MKNYAIYDKDLDRELAIGYLLYYDKADSFIIELCEDLDEWDAPLLFQKFIREKQYTISREVSLMWVRERIIPSGRQNIGSILKNHKLNSYSEIVFLALAKGRCSQDNCYIEEISEEDIPKEIMDRRQKNVWECFPTEDNQLLCLFKDDVVQKINLTLLYERYVELSRILRNRDVLDTLKVGVGGYSIVFNDSFEIQALDLRAVGTTIPLTSKDFYNFIRRNVTDTTKVCDMLQCTRQNLAYMVKEDKIQPIIRGTKENLYLKGEVESLL